MGVPVYMDWTSPMDLFTRVIVGWSVDDNMQESFVREPLEKALLKRKHSQDYNRTL
ncbi:MAG: hypothetical protein MUF58_02290 [Arcicella sp.]|jgi:transposase InsO family protein|nr:hypothetical protein [Arcicella sp.]